MKDEIAASTVGKAFLGKLKTGLALSRGSAPEVENGNIGIMVALSGGADSTALLLGLCALAKEQKLTLAACHVNHKLRGADAEADAEHCQDLCAQLSVPLVLKVIDHVELANLSEERLREKRYKLLREAARSKNLPYIATAHICEDQLETIMFRLFRGTSLRGLTGMRKRRKLEDDLHLLRPLLHVSKSDCRQYVEGHEIKWRQDKSNEDVQYTRNYLRHIVVPKILQRFPGFPQQLASLQAIISAEEEFWDELTLASLEGLSSFYQSDDIWPVEQFANLPTALQRRVLAESLRRRQIEVSFVRVEAILSLINASPGDQAKGKAAMTLSSDWTIRISSGRLQWLRTQTIDSIRLTETPVRIPGINIALACGKVLRIEDLADVKQEEIGGFAERSALDVIVDLGKTKRPLVLRSRRQGDVITPFGMNVAVSLKKYLHTHKPQPGADLQKLDSIPLLADQEEVLWIPGIGMSERLRADKRPSHRLSWLDIAADPLELA